VSESAQGAGTNGTISTAISALVKGSAEFAELSLRLARFNIFRTLRAQRNELRHSNMLAWLLDPAESHGAGSQFVRLWLAEVFSVAASSGAPAPPDMVSTALAELAIDRVEIHRELDRMDLVVEIHRRDGVPWIVCIENKVDARQGSDQLARYFELTDRRFPGTDQKIHVFLTRRNEQPNHSAFVPVTYATVARALAPLTEQLSASADQKILMRHYLDLLKDEFMPDDGLQQLADDIWRKHRTALEFLADHRVRVVGGSVDVINQAIKERQEEWDISLCKSDRRILRFIPRAWEIDENRGEAWESNGRLLLCELHLPDAGNSEVEFQIVLGKAPADVVAKLRTLADDPSGPFKPPKTGTKDHWVKPYIVKSNIRPGAMFDHDQLPDQVVKWLSDQLDMPAFKQATEMMVPFLQSLARPVPDVRP
jgi:hypothetical protein